MRFLGFTESPCAARELWKISLDSVRYTTGKGAICKMDIFLKKIYNYLVAGKANITSEKYKICTLIERLAGN